MKKIILILLIINLIVLSGCGQKESSSQLSTSQQQSVLSSTKQNKINCADILWQEDENDLYIFDFSQEVWEECYHKKICLTGNSIDIRKCIKKPTKVYELGFSSCVWNEEWYVVVDIMKRCNLIRKPSTDFSWCGKCLECDKYDDIEKIKDWIGGYKITKRTYCLWGLAILQNNDQICNYIKNDEIAKKDCITG